MSDKESKEMKVTAINYYGKNKERLEVAFKLPNKTFMIIGRIRNKWYVEANDQNIDRVQEAIEMVKSGKLEIEI